MNISNNKIQEAEFVDSPKEQVKFIELKDFFSSEHVKRLTDDVHDNKHLTLQVIHPIDGDPSSLFPFADMVDNDESGFYESALLPILQVTKQKQLFLKSLD